MREVDRIRREAIVPKATWREWEELAAWRPVMDDLNPNFSELSLYLMANRAVLVVVVNVAARVAQVQAEVVVPGDEKDRLVAACH